MHLPPSMSSSREAGRGRRVVGCRRLTFLVPALAVYFRQSVFFCPGLSPKSDISPVTTARKPTKFDVFLVGFCFGSDDRPRPDEPLPAVSRPERLLSHPAAVILLTRIPYPLFRRFSPNRTPWRYIFPSRPARSGLKSPHSLPPRPNVLPHLSSPARHRPFWTRSTTPSFSLSTSSRSGSVLPLPIFIPP